MKTSIALHPTPPMRRRLGLAAVGLALVALAPGCKKDEAKAEVPAMQIPAGEVWLTPEQVKEAKIDTQTIADRDVDDTILTSGRVTFDDLKVAHIYSPVNGKVTKIYAPLGTWVKQGQPLATIESPEIGSAVSDLHKAEADMIAADHDYKREKELSARGAGTQKDLEQAEDRFRQAKAEMERAQKKAYLLRAGGVDAVSQTFTLSSPIEGEVIARGVNPGIEVQGQYGGNNVVELFTVGQLDKVWVLADIYEMDLARVKIGSPALVTTVAYKGRKFEGRVDWVSGMLDPTTRTAKVRLTFDNACSGDPPKVPAKTAPTDPLPAPKASSTAHAAPPPPVPAATHATPTPSDAAAPPVVCNRLLKPEMYATAQISVEQRRALAIPRSSILRLGDHTVVFLEVGAADGKVKFERVPVSVDEGESSDWLVVEHGLTAGQKIVTSGAIKLAANL